MMKVNVENMKGNAGKPVKNQFIIETNEGIFFQSYRTIIAAKINGRIILDPQWEYSTTTGKYRNIFLGESKRETEVKIKSGIYTIQNLN